jgi:hypothetical protein
MRATLVVIGLVLVTVLVGVAGQARPAAAAGSCGTTNVALGAAATASSTSGTMTPAKAIDNKTTTRWASLASDPQWLQLDFGSRPNVCQVSLNWMAYASAYSIQISDDASHWITLATTGASSNTVQTLSVFGTGRYLRMYGTARGVSSTGYSLKEFQVFSQPSQPPAFTSGSTATFVTGQPASFTVTTSAIPTVTLIAESGSLPAGLTFTDNGNGTAAIAGTPTGSGGSYPVTLTATNGVSPNATQNLSIQVNQAPAITLNPSDQTVTPGQSVSFTAGASGVPTPTVQWQRSTDGGASFVNVAGATSTTYTFTAAAGDNANQYRAVFSDGVGSPATTTAATLTVGTAPVITSANHASLVVGTAGSFGITTTGVPPATLSKTGAQFPAWLTLTDNGDGTGSLTGTPPAGAAGQYQFTLKAANGFSPSASQVFTLFVDDSPVITSANHATFTAGSAGSFAVTTTAGFPTTTAITESGPLPSGVTFTDNGDGTATLAGAPAVGSGGSYPLTITATASGGSAAPATQSFTLTVLAPPVITSANHATFTAGTTGSFTVTTSAGNPAATTLSKTGTLPTGVTFTDNGDGTATIAGTPGLGSGGVYPITITASNGAAPDATQSFTLTVNEPPSISSADHTTFTVGAAGSFTVTTAGGQPTAVGITESGSLPAGITFTDNGDGTATLGGTPTAGGTFPITITASNGVAPNATQVFTLTVDEPPSISSANHTTFAVGAAGSFTVTSTAGFPTATALTEAGGLPSGLSFTDNGDGTAALAGTPATGTGGSYSLTLTATNSTGHTDQAFTLTVTDSPVITSANHTTFTTGTSGSFTVTTTPGTPTATTITKTGALPSGVTFTDNGDGTAMLSGTPTSGGTFPITVTASNGISPNATQGFTLTVNDPPVIGGPNAVT